MQSANSITSVTEFNCTIHKREKATHLCIDYFCTNSPLLCATCFSDNLNRALHATHEDNIIKIPASIQILAQTIESAKPQMDKLFNRAVSKKQADNLLRKMEMGERHYQFLDTHIKNLKSQVDREVQSLKTDLERKLILTKNSLFSQLDSYQKLYIQNMQAYRELVEPVISFNKKVKYYSNPNNLALKLLSETRRKSTEWFTELKKILGTTSKIVDKPGFFSETLNKSTHYMLTTSEDLPYVKHNDPSMIESKSSKLQSLLSEAVGDMIMLKELKPLSMHSLENNSVLDNMYRGPSYKDVLPVPSLTSNLSLVVQPQNSYSYMHPVTSATDWNRYTRLSK